IRAGAEQGAGAAAVDQVAEFRDVLRHAELQGVLLRDDTDGAFQVDIEIVDRGGEAIDEGRRQHDAELFGVGRLRLQVQVAAEEAAALTGDALRGVLVLVHRHAGALAVRQGGEAVDALRIGTTARIGTAPQTERLRREELDDVRCTHRTLVARTQTEVVDRLPFRAVLVRVHRTREVVRRVAVAGVGRQILEERHILNDRDTHLAEDFLEVVTAVRALRRAALTGEVTAREFEVGAQVEDFLAILAADRKRDRALRPRGLNAPRAEVAGQAGARNP